MPIGKSCTVQLDNADIGKTSNSFSSLGCQREATPCHTGTITPSTGADTSLLACSVLDISESEILLTERCSVWCLELDCATSPYGAWGL